MTEAQWLASSDPQAMLSALLGARATDPVPPHLVDFKASDRKLRLLTVAFWRVRSELNGRPSPHEGEILPLSEAVADGAPLPSDLSRLDYGQISGAMWAPLQPDAGGAAAGMMRGLSPMERPRFAALMRDIIGNPWRPVTLPKGPRCERCRLRPPWQEVYCPACERCPWLTPQVLSLAEAAYEERPGRECPHCAGKGQRSTCGSICNACYGTGRVEGAALDPLRLVILADALEEEGCPAEIAKSHPCLFCGGHGTLMQAAPDKGEAPRCDFCGGTGTKHWPHPLLAHLRSPGPHYRGMWSLDLVLGKE